MACTHGMRVRSPPSPPETPSSDRSGCRALDPVMPVHLPTASTGSCVAEGRDGDLGSLISSTNAGSIPASATTAGSFNGRTVVLQTAHGGSIPSPATTSMVGEGKRRAAGP